MSSAIEAVTVPTTVKKPLLGLRGMVQAFSILSRLGLGGIFVWTSLAKLEQPYDFLFFVYNYELVGPQFGVWIATAVPWLELVVGISLLVGLWELGAWLLGTGLLAAFTFAQLSAMTRGLLIPCGCAKGDQELVTWQHASQTGLLLLACAIGLSCSLLQRRWRGEGPGLGTWHS